MKAHSLTGHLPSPPPLSAFGGLEGIRETLTTFYQRVYQDPMIGYLFVGQEMARLIEREVEWTARALGLEVEYQGRPLRQAHGAHPIRRGHFHRRNQLLIESIKARGLSEEALQWWRAHSASLEAAILGGATNDTRCEQTSNDYLRDPISAPPALQTWGGDS